jgi:ribosomal protein S18 acetylase RimI-like enzyme
MNAGAAVPFGWARSARAGLTFRPVADADQAFLARVYASTHKQEFADTPIAEVQKAALLLLQFRAQQAHFAKHYPQADRLVIMGGGYDIGRLYIARWPDRHGIIDLTLLPEFRGRGAGGVLLRDLIDEAAAAGSELSVLVEKSNPAMRLLQRLGFVTGEDKGAHDLMRWSAG